MSAPVLLYICSNTSLLHEENKRTIAQHIVVNTVILRIDERIVFFIWPIYEQAPTAPAECPLPQFPVKCPRNCSGCQSPPPIYCNSMFENWLPTSEPPVPAVVAESEEFITPLLMAATARVLSPEIAAAYHAKVPVVFAAQVCPESNDAYTAPPFTTATSVLPSFDELMKFHARLEPRCVQLFPESPEV